MRIHDLRQHHANGYRDIVLGCERMFVTLHESRKWNFRDYHAEQ
ncbi:hypothetical protein OF001_U30276 [Pseudomonas sp. OF001]|nr:hypothetical protein OF001_U30276 [Pseudomonas sp. OF001]